jgi:hypothetical protein
MLHHASHRNKQLESTRRILILGPPVILHHNRCRIADPASENLGGDPGLVYAGWRKGIVRGGTVEHLHLARCEDRYYVQIPSGQGIILVEVDIGLDECGPGLKDSCWAGDHGFECEGAGAGVTL